MTAPLAPLGLMTTPLDALHREIHGQMVDFAGYALPVQYKAGIIAEARAARTEAALFDVSHMGPCEITLTEPSGDAELDWHRLASLLEALTPSDLRGLKPGELRYTTLLNADGGVLDDLMIGRTGAGTADIVVNAATKEADFALLSAALASKASLRRRDHDALVALQGPAAEAALSALVPGVERLFFMQFGAFDYQGRALRISRSGYTGEDGFEILLPAAMAEAFARTLLGDKRVQAAGLGARDALRLEAGLCLYGHDLTPERTPIAAGLAFVVARRRREARDFPGAERILRELADGPRDRLTALVLMESGVAREGAAVLAGGREIGIVTSGGYAPNLSYEEPGRALGGAIALAYLDPAHAVPGAQVEIILRGKPRAARITALPFVPHRYKRAPRASI